MVRLERRAKLRDPLGPDDLCEDRSHRLETLSLPRPKYFCARSDALSRAQDFKAKSRFLRSIGLSIRTRKDREGIIFFPSLLYYIVINKNLNCQFDEQEKFTLVESNY